jgi:hypothetical protein
VGSISSKPSGGALVLLVRIFGMLWSETSPKRTWDLPYLYKPCPEKLLLFWNLAAGRWGWSSPVQLTDIKMVMIEVIANDRLGKKVRIKCDSEDTVGDLKVLPMLSRLMEWNSLRLEGSSHQASTSFFYDRRLTSRNSSPHRQVLTGERSSSKNGIIRTKTTSNFPTMKFTTEWAWSYIIVKRMMAKVC